MRHYDDGWTEGYKRGYDDGHAKGVSHSNVTPLQAARAARDKEVKALLIDWATTREANRRVQEQLLMDGVARADRSAPLDPQHASNIERLREIGNERAADIRAFMNIGLGPGDIAPG